MITPAKNSHCCVIHTLFGDTRLLYNSDTVVPLFAPNGQELSFVQLLEGFLNVNICCLLEWNEITLNIKHSFNQFFFFLRRRHVLHNCTSYIMEQNCYFFVVLLLSSHQCYFITSLFSIITSPCVLFILYYRIVISFFMDSCLIKHNMLHIMLQVIFWPL